MNRGLRIALIVIGIAILAGATGFIAWGLTPLGPDADALAAVASDDTVTFQDEGNRLLFTPTARLPAAGFILYPGGHVDYRSYAPIARRMAGQGYLVIVVRMPLSLAFFGTDRADGAIAANPSVRHWVVGGHSLGGTAAASYARTHPDTVSGLALWASYPAAGDDLSATTLQALSIYGSNDRVLNGENLNATLPLLPPRTSVRVLQGGNHAQFGSYGPHPGDGTATISAADQQALAADLTAGLLGAVEGG